MPASHLIILVHGIRDPGFWQDDLKAQFESRKGVTVVNAKADVVDLFRFLSPIQSMRERPVNRVKAVIENAIAANPNADVTIIAHSFGTWMVSKILHEDTNILLDRLILCGSIVPNDFRWDRILKINLAGAGKAGKKSAKMAIVNEYSPLDVWPLTAKVASYGYGNTGSRGIGDSGVTDRRHSIPHSGYLDTAFALKYWDPFIFQNRIVSSEPQPVKTPWYFVLTRIPANYMTLALTTGFLLAGASGFYALNHSGNLEITALTYGDAQIRLASGATELRFPEFKFTNSDYLEIFQHRDLSGKLRLKAHSLKTADKFEIEVSNRPPIACEEETGVSWTDHRTTYQIAYRRQSWWRNILKWNWRGAVEMELNYNPGKSENGKHDVLSVKSASGIAPGTSIVVVPSHNPDNCLDAELKDQMFTVPREFAGTGSRGLLQRLFGISIAWAADEVKTQLKSLLGSRDKTARSLAIDNIKRDPGQLSDAYPELLDPASSPAQISDVLTGIADSRDPGTIFSPSVLERVFELSWDDDPQKRAAARRFLRTEMVARTNATARFVESIDANRGQLAGNYVGPGAKPQEEKLYLALVALRDVYYNSALFKFDSAADAGGDAIKPAVDSAMALFSECGALSQMARPEVRFGFAKCAYGKAFMLYRYARIQYAMANGEAAKDPSSGAIQRDLIRFEEAAVQLALGQYGAGEAHAAFGEFLGAIDGNEANYPWQHHVSQARACTLLLDRLPFNCLKAE